MYMYKYVHTRPFIFIYPATRCDFRFFIYSVTVYIYGNQADWLEFNLCIKIMIKGNFETSLALLAGMYIYVCKYCIVQYEE